MHEVSPISTPHTRCGTETRTKKKTQKLILEYAKVNLDLVKIALPHEKQNDVLVIHPDRPAPHQVATAAQGEPFTLTRVPIGRYIISFPHRLQTF